MLSNSQTLSKNLNLRVKTLKNINDTTFKTNTKTVLVTTVTALDEMDTRSPVISVESTSECNRFSRYQIKI